MSNGMLAGDGIDGVRAPVPAAPQGAWYDVVVVGAGAAGLNGALALVARSRQRW